MRPTHLFSAPRIGGEGQLGSMYGELTSINNMCSDHDSNLRPCDHKAQTLTTTPSLLQTKLTPRHS